MIWWGNLVGPRVIAQGRVVSEISDPFLHDLLGRAHGLGALGLETVNIVLDVPDVGLVLLVHHLPQLVIKIGGFVGIWLFGRQARHLRPGGGWHGKRRRQKH